MSMTLWDAKKVGDFLGVKPRTVVEKYQVRDDFPKPYRTPRLRWDAEEVEKWVKRQRQAS